jgi:hypothetical protein
MRFRINHFGVLLALGFAGGTALSPAPTWASNNITYNFNEDNGTEVGWFTDTTGTAPLWDWNTGPSVIGGGWQAFSGTNSANSASYLTSPCFVIDHNNDWVNFKVDHRFNFPLSGTTANQLGQVQYRVDTGSGWGAWSGIPTEFFVKPNGNPEPNAVLPDYGPPLFPPLVETSGTLPVQAWSGTSLNFATGFHEPSEFTLFFDDFSLQNGYDIQFRFAMATNAAVSGTDTIVWEVNKVQIEGVVPCLIPEPAALTLAGIGGLGCLLVARRRRRWRPVASLRAVCGSTAATIVAVVVIGCLLAAAPARAQTSTSWNFQLDDGNWTTAGQRLKQPPNAAAFWTWSSPSIAVNGGPNPHWHVTSEGVARSTASSYSITSPVLTTTGTVNSARISIAHDFLFRTGTAVTPLYAGQFEYQLNNSGTWVGLPLSAFTSGSVNVFNPVFGFSPFWSGTSLQLVDQSAFVLPNYLTPTGTNALPFLAPGAAAFTGTSPGWPTAYVPTQAFLSGTALVPALGIQSLQLRFANLNYGAGCLPEDGWNVKFVQVDFSDAIDPVPEPATLALAGLALAVLGARAAARRWAYQRASRPSDSP